MLIQFSSFQFDWSVLFYERNDMKLKKSQQETDRSRFLDDQKKNLTSI